MLELSWIKHNNRYLNTQEMHVHMKHNVGGLVVFYKLLRRVHLEPRLTKLICLQQLLATFIKIMGSCYTVYFSLWFVKVVSGCHCDFILHGCLQMEWPLLDAWNYAYYPSLDIVGDPKNLVITSKYFIVARHLHLKIVQAWQHYQRKLGTSFLWKFSRLHMISFSFSFVFENEFVASL